MSGDQVKAERRNYDGLLPNKRKEINLWRFERGPFIRVKYVREMRKHEMRTEPKPFFYITLPAFQHSIFISLYIYQVYTLNEWMDPLHLEVLVNDIMNSRWD